MDKNNGEKNSKKAHVKTRIRTSAKTKPKAAHKEIKPANRPSLFDSKPLQIRFERKHRTLGKPLDDEQSSKSEVKLSRELTQKPLLIISGNSFSDPLSENLVKVLQDLGFASFVLVAGAQIYTNRQVKTIERTIDTAKTYLSISSNLSLAESLVKSWKVWSYSRSLAKRLVKRALDLGIKYAVIIDDTTCHFNLAASLKSAGLQVIYVNGPGIWSLPSYYKIHNIKNNVDLVLSFFPFEQELYRREGIACHCIGYPSHTTLALTKKREQESYPQAMEEKLTIAFSLGENSYKAKGFCATMVKVSKALYEKYPNCRFIISGADPLIEAFLTKSYADRSNIPLEYYSAEHSASVIEMSDFVILSSETDALTAVQFMKPMLLVYRRSWLHFFITANCMRMPYFCIVNLLANQQVVPELLQTEITSQNIVRAIEHFIEDRVYNEAVTRKLDSIRNSLQKGKPILKAGHHIADFLTLSEQNKDEARTHKTTTKIASHAT